MHFCGFFLPVCRKRNDITYKIIKSIMKLKLCKYDKKADFKNQTISSN